MRTDIGHIMTRQNIARAVCVRARASARVRPSIRIYMYMIYACMYVCVCMCVCDWVCACASARSLFHVSVGHSFSVFSAAAGVQAQASGG